MKKMKRLLLLALLIGSLNQTFTMSEEQTKVELEDTKKHQRTLLQDSLGGPWEAFMSCINEGVLNERDGEGQTVLQNACHCGIEATKYAQALIAAKADPNIADNWGDTALMSAVIRENEILCADLIKAKADVNAQNKGKTSILHWAVYSDNPNIINLLLAANVDRNAVNDLKHNPLEEAVILNKNKAIEALKPTDMSLAQLLQKTSNAIKCKAASACITFKLVRPGIFMAIVNGPDTSELNSRLKRFEKKVSAKEAFKPTTQSIWKTPQKILLDDLLKDDQKKVNVKSTSTEEMD